MKLEKYMDDKDRKFLEKHAVRVPASSKEGEICIDDLFGQYDSEIEEAWCIEVRPFDCVGICRTSDGEWYVEKAEEGCSSMVMTMAVSGFKYTMRVCKPDTVRGVVMRLFRDPLDEARITYETLNSAFRSKFSEED